MSENLFFFMFVCSHILTWRTAWLCAVNWKQTCLETRCMPATITWQCPPFLLLVWLVTMTGQRSVNCCFTLFFILSHVSSWQHPAWLTGCWSPVTDLHVSWPMSRLPHSCPGLCPNWSVLVYVQTNLFWSMFRLTYTCLGVSPAVIT